MHADLVADLPISVWRLAVDGPAGKERPCLPCPPKMVNAHGFSTSVSNDAAYKRRRGSLRSADASAPEVNLISCASAYSPSTFAAICSTANAT